MFSVGREAAPAISTGRPPAILLKQTITEEDAVKVFRRRVPGAEVEVRAVAHPFWWAGIGVQTRGLFSRKPAVPEVSPLMDVLVNAQTGRGFIAEFSPQGVEVSDEVWENTVADSRQGRELISTEDAMVIARALVRTKAVKTVKLGIGISLEERIAPRRVLKPNWIVTGTNGKYAATFLVDGLDSSHYVVRAEKL